MQAWITEGDGPTVELAITDDRLAVIASRLLPADASREAWDEALVALAYVRMGPWLLSSSGYCARVARL
jgi:hypothetical protein